MKLIYIANARIPTEKAHGIQIMEMCQSFTQSDANDANEQANDANKIEVELVVPWRFNSIKQDPFEYYDIQRNFKITKIFSLDLVKFGKIGFLIQSLSFAELATYYILIKSLFKKIDVIYSRDELPLFYLSFLGRKNLFWESHTAKKNFIIKRILKKCKGIITITQGLKDFYIKEYDINPDKILVAPDGANLEKFKIQESKSQIRDKLGLPQDKKIIVYTGSFYLYDWKGIDILLEAVRYFENDWLLLLVGGNEKEIEEIKKKYDSDNILLVEHKHHSEIPSYLTSADALVLPNKKGYAESERDTSPIKLFEYMASGVPIVASDLSSIREILNENNTVFVEPNNPKSLANGIKKVLQNADFADRISKQALEDVQNYTWQKRAGKILKFISIR